MRSYGCEATYFHDKEVPKIGSDYTCSAVISLKDEMSANVFKRM